MGIKAQPTRIFFRYGVAVLFVALATSIRFLFLGSLESRAAFVTFYPAVILAALVGGLCPGLLAGILSAAVATYWMEPRGQFFVVETPADRLSLFVFCMSAAMISFSIEAMHRARTRADLAEADARMADERARSAEILREKEGYLATTLHSIGDAVLATDNLGRVTMMNPVAEKLTCWTEAEAIGRPVVDVFNIINERTRETVGSPVERCLREGVIVGLANHTLLISKTGIETPIDDSGAPIRDSNGKALGAVLVFRDITERKRAEEELRRADRSKDEFLAMLAHELRNPLGAISNAATLISLKVSDDQDAAKPIEILNRQVRHTARLVDDLLDVSRITQGRLELRKELVDLTLIAERACEAIRGRMALVPLEFTVTLPDEPMWMMGDPTRLEQVFGNLLDNAAKYTDSAGCVSLTLTGDDRQATVRVVDTGIGISPDTLPYVFELFSQEDHSLDRSRGGLGIGLKLVKTLVEMHGGSVDAASRGRGKGTTFTVKLPLPPDRRASIASQAPGQPSTVAGPKSILVVEDNVDAAGTLAEILTLSGHHVQIAYSGRSALELAQQGAPDIVLLDIGLPEMDGFEVALRIREIDTLKGTRVVALTGYAQENDRRRSRDAGFDDYLVKPVSIQALEELFERYQRAK